MSLSVEDVQFVLSKFEVFELAVYDDDEQPCRGADKIIVEALRELIAIKETEPVAEVCLNYSDDDRYKHGLDYSRSEIDSIAVGTQLIIKPE